MATIIIAFFYNNKHCRGEKRFKVIVVLRKKAPFIIQFLRVRRLNFAIFPVICHHMSTNIYNNYPLNNFNKCKII